MALRLAYTYYKHSQQKAALSTASTASPPTYSHATEPPAYSSVSTHDLTLIEHDLKSNSGALASTTISNKEVHSNEPASAERILSSPVSQPLAVFPQFIAQKPETIVMTERLLSLQEGSFRVQTVDGQEILGLDADAFSLSRRKRVTDTDGTHLFTIRKELFTLPRSYYAEDPQGNKILDVEGKFSVGTSRAEAHFTNALNGEIESLFMKGSFFNKHTVITHQRTGAVVAEINREFLNARQIFGHRQTYTVTVAPGVDMALIVAMCVCLDERRDQRCR